MSSSDRDRLDGRRALVTGGSKGSGKAVVERLRELGADVYVTARTMPDGYEHPDRFIEADMLTIEGANAVAARIAEVGGALDILVHVVGVSVSHWSSVMTAMIKSGTGVVLQRAARTQGAEEYPWDDSRTPTKTPSPPEWHGCAVSLTSKSLPCLR